MAKRDNVIHGLRKRIEKLEADLSRNITMPLYYTKGRSDVIEPKDWKVEIKAKPKPTGQTEFATTVIPSKSKGNWAQEVSIYHMEDEHLRNAISYVQRRLSHGFGTIDYIDRLHPLVQSLNNFLSEAERRGIRV